MFCIETIYHEKKEKCSSIIIDELTDIALFPFFISVLHQTHIMYHQKITKITRAYRHNKSYLDVKFTSIRPRESTFSNITRRSVVIKVRRKKSII